MPRHLAQFLHTVRWRALRPGWWRCPNCHWPLQLKLRDSDHGVRCAHCGASAITQSLLSVLAAQVPEIGAMDCLELSARGMLVQWLRRHAGTLTCTEFRPERPLGSIVNGVRNEDVQRLTFADAQFGLCTSTEVFEHVADDAAGFAEVQRVLKPGGRFIFTVPLTGAEQTVERAHMEAGRVVHHLAPEYHADPFSGSKRILAFRNYGKDITTRLRTAGFARAEAMVPAASMFGFARTVIVARKDGDKR